MIVGLTGKKRSGKDTFATTLIRDYGFQRVAFADALKEAALALDPIVAQACGCTGEAPIRLSEVVTAMGWEQAKEVQEVRRTLQRFGVGIRDIAPDFWIDAAVMKMDGPGDYVVTDVRFPNEVGAIEDLRGHVVRIERPGLASDDQHASETALDDYDAPYAIVNGGTVDDLAAAAHYLIRELRGT